ncbi:MAG: cache domain-containing protein [Rickettsiales bacterium]|nr:cache domain-containing protein [Rickettsiales bacterium]
MLKFLKKSKKISKKSLIKYLLTSYLLLVLTLFYLVYKNYVSYLELQKTKMTAAAYEIESRFSNIMDYSESVLNSLGRKIAVTKGKKEQVNQILQSFNASDTDYKSINNLLSEGIFFWIDARKMLTMSSQYGVVDVPIDVSGRDYLFLSEKNPWKIFIGNSTIGAVSGEYVMPAGVGIVDWKNNYLGTIAISFKIYDLVKEFSKFSDFYQIDFVVLNNKDEIVIESAASKFLEDLAVLKNLQLLNDQDNHQKVLDFRLSNKTSDYAILRNFEKYSYKILIVMKNRIIFLGAFYEILPDLIELIIITFLFSTILYFVRKL